MRATLSAMFGTALLAAAPASAFDPTGEVFLTVQGTSSGAVFDEERVAGPGVNMTGQEDGSWAGDVDGQNLDLDIENGRASAPNFAISYRKDGDEVRVEGLVGDSRLRVVIGPRHATARFGECSFDLDRKGPGTFYGSVGCVRRGGRGVGLASERLGGLATNFARLTLEGEAATADPPEPQLALALIAVLPRR
jgi:hypothetical protein